MDDMHPFERQVATEVAREMRPSRPVDTAAVIAAVDAVRSPTWRFLSMFSATKLVLAGAIVALFGGLMLSGVLTQPSRDEAPAVGASAPATTQADSTDATMSEPEPTTESGVDEGANNSDLLPGVDLVAAEVEPGVFRVMSDGTGNDLSLSVGDLDGHVSVIAGRDESVWLRIPSKADDHLLRLGTAGKVDASSVLDWAPDITVADDGAVWALGRSATPRGTKGQGQLFSLVDGGWTRHPVPAGAKLTGIEAPGDGSIWASLAVERGRFDCEEDDYHSGRIAVARLVDGEWRQDDIEPAIQAADGGSLAVSPDGTALLGTHAYHSRVCRPTSAWAPQLLERREDGWAPLTTLGPLSVAQGGRGIGPIAVGSNGTAWAWMATGAGPWGSRLARLADGTWEVFGEDESVPQLVGGQSWNANMTISNDGSLWIAFDSPFAVQRHKDEDKSFVATLEGPCLGVLSFDGSTWSQRLAGACATHVSAAPDGSVWVAVLEPSDHRGRIGSDREPTPLDVASGIYVITPEAVPDAE